MEKLGFSSPLFFLISMNHISKLKWQCRRGMKELDLLLTRYLEQQYPHASTATQHTFQVLLELPDIDLYSYMIGQETPAEETLRNLIEELKQLRVK